MPKRVLVTGGAGFVGSHLVERLVLAGYEVSVVDDLSRGKREWLAANVSFYEVDIRDAVGVAAAFELANPDVLVHLAALHFIPAVEDAPEFAHSINVDGTRNVLTAAGRTAAESLIFASTAAVYPDVGSAIDESVAPAPIDLYGRTKVAGERLLIEAAAAIGASATSARLFNVIGPRETNPHVLPEIVGQLRAGATTLELGNLDPRRDYVDVRDVADALMCLVTTPGEGFSTFNVGSGLSVSVRELVEECGSILGRDIEIRQDPIRMRPVERMMLLSDSSAITRAVGWRPARTLRTTLEELLSA